MRKINQVSFPGDVRDFAMSLDLRLDMLISNLLKKQLGYIRSFSFVNNAVAFIYLNRVNISLNIFYQKMND